MKAERQSTHPFMLMLTDEMHDAIKNVATQKKTTATAVIREAIAEKLAQQAPTTGIVMPPPPPARVWPEWNAETFLGMSLEDRKAWMKYMEANRKDQ